MMKAEFAICQVEFVMHGGCESPCAGFDGVYTLCVSSTEIKEL